MVATTESSDSLGEHRANLEECEQRIRDLEKENRILKKKLNRTERNHLRLEQSRQKADYLLHQTIQELKESQSTLEVRSLELQQALTDLQTMQSRLLMTEKMSALGVLVAGVAHEINNPVSFIYGNIDHADEYITDLLELVKLYQQHFRQGVPAIQKLERAIDIEFIQDDLPKIMESMRMGTERIKQIVLSLRNFSRMDEAEYKVVDLHEGLDNTLIILANRLKANGDIPEVTIQKNYGELPLIECYAGQMNQVFMNILTNAIDALREHQIADPAITLTTVIQPNKVDIKIADNGPGIPTDYLQRIFDPFFTTKPIGKGTGMGLSISYQIITEKHRGQLTCTSNPEQGTEFKIEIPIQQ